jgi:hypothetical protein
MNAQEQIVHAAAAPARSSRSPLLRLFNFFASLKLTVWILLFFGVLTWAGTLAQKDLGLFIVQRDFFESFFVRWDTGIEIGSGSGLVLKVPLPGGYLLMLLLFINLMVGGVMRLRWSARNLGVLVTHLGMAFLLVAGFVKLHYSYAGHVAFYEGAKTSTMVSLHDFELALLRKDGAEIVERTLPEAALTGMPTIDDPGLPFVLRIHDWMESCGPELKVSELDVDVPVVIDPSGDSVYLSRRSVSPNREESIAGCYVTVRDRATGVEKTGILWGADFRPRFEQRAPFTFESGGTTWGLDLRRVTWDLPFAVRLDKFQKTDHPGTMTPRDFSSWVTVFDDDVEQQFHIYMNHPLRREGHVFFQTNWGPQPNSGLRGPPWYSVFEVASNPSDYWPEAASYVILAGLLLHFVTKLFRYLRSSNRAATAPELS